MRDPKLVRELAELTRRYPTLGDLRKNMPPGAKKILIGAERHPDPYPTSLAVEEYLSLFD